MVPSLGHKNLELSLGISKNHSALSERTERVARTCVCVYVCIHLCVHVHFFSCLHAQKNPYIKVVYFGVAYSEPPQKPHLMKGGY